VARNIVSNCNRTQSGANHPVDFAYFDTLLFKQLNKVSARIVKKKRIFYDQTTVEKTT
jgi:predicted ATPase